MDSKTLRLILMLGLALVLGTLWSKWQMQYGAKPVAAVQSASSVSSSQAPNLAVNNTPTAPDANASTTAVVARNSESQAALIHVRTNVLDVAINLNGGSIVNAELLKYPAELHSSQPVVLLNNDPASQYIAQSGVISAQLPQQMRFVSAKTDYTVKQGAATVTLTYKAANGITVLKTYSFDADKYTIGVNYQINNNSRQAFSGRFYGQLLRVPPAEEHGMFMRAFTGAAISSPNDHYQKFTFKELSEANLDQSATSGWAAMIQHYFISAWIPQSGQQIQIYSQDFNNSSYAVGIANNTISVPAKATGSTGATLYVGPALTDQLQAAAPYLNLTVDYGWLWFISQLLFWLLSHIYSFIGNWGWSIVILTAIIKIVFYPLSAKSFRSMARMRQLQPKMAQLRERFGDDRQKLSRAIMEMYREEKVNPMSGCLPMIIQIPVFIALYWVLMESVELRQAPFILWLHDLSMHDPYYILPVLMGASMFVQQRLNPAPPDPMQAKMMMFLPVIFTVMFLGFPAGLVLYWIVNNCITILQQWWVTRHYRVKPEKK